MSVVQTGAIREPGAIRKIVYFGTPEIAAKPLRALHSAGFEAMLAVTRHPQRRSRRGHLELSPVEAVARTLGLPVAYHMDDDIVLEAAETADLGVVVAYGKMIGEALLNRITLVNLHFSQLPRWRGAAPVERAILAGDSETGVCLMKVTAGLDEGPVYHSATTHIDTQETASELRDRLCDIGIRMLLDALNSGLPEPVSQVGDVTYAHKITSSDRRIKWNASSLNIHRAVRVGGAWTTFRGQRLKILKTRLQDTHLQGRSELEQPGGGEPACGETEQQPACGEIVCGEIVCGEIVCGEIVGNSSMNSSMTVNSKSVMVATGDGVIELVIVQPANRAAVPAYAWRNGARFKQGDRFE